MINDNTEQTAPKPKVWYSTTNMWALLAVCLILSTGFRYIFETLMYHSSPWAYMDGFRVGIIKVLLLLYAPSIVVSQVVASAYLPFYRIRIPLECVLSGMILFGLWQSLLLWPLVRRKEKSPSLPSGEAAVQPNTSLNPAEQLGYTPEDTPLPSTPKGTKKIWRMNRREFLRAGVVVAALPPATSLAYGSFYEPFLLNVQRYPLALKNLSPEFHGLKIVQISDTHYGPYVSLDQLKSVVEQANALQPDVVFLTGDYVSKSRTFIREGVKVFEKLTPRLGMFAVLGNHDHWEGADETRMELRKIGALVIDNQRLFLKPAGEITAFEPQDQPALAICGVGDFWEDSMEFEVVLHGIRPNTPRLLLSHNPDSADKLPKGLRCDAIFSGHTHGGQINLPGLPNMSPVKNKDYTGGYCQGPFCPVYVSRGVGMSVLPYRMNVPPEISLFTLSTAPD